MREQTILVAEDNDRLRRFIASSLDKAGYEVVEAPSGKDALAALKGCFLDCVLLDIRLGDMSGLDILRIIRRQDELLPVIVVSSAADQAMKLDGFTIGCDDYITKPFYVEELLLRVGRVLARSQGRAPSGPIVSEPLRCGPFVLDIASLTVMKGERKIPMRKKVFDLFLFFARHPGAVLSSESLYSRAWDSREDMNENSLYVHIRELRKLIEDDPSDPRFIRTVRGAGYVFSAGD